MSLKKKGGEGLSEQHVETFNFLQFAFTTTPGLFTQTK
jgi:hypothetical protein